MKKISTLLIFFLLTGAFLSACNLPNSKSVETAQPTTSIDDQIGTVAALTVVALSTQLAPQATTPAPAVQTPVPPTATLQPTATNTFTPPTAQPPTATPMPCDKAKFSSETIPDGTIFAPGAAFVKTWKLINDGSCTWTTAYKLVFDSGNALDGPATVALPKNVAPGEAIELSINLKAPTSPNKYRGNWKLQNASGVKFGLGSKASDPFWVDIVVATTAVPFAITRADITVDTADFSGTCPHIFNFTAAIKSTAAGKVTFFWELSDGTRTPVQTIEFTEAGTKSVAYALEVTATKEDSIKIYIDNPNHQYFPAATFKLTCTP